MGIFSWLFGKKDAGKLVEELREQDMGLYKEVSRVYSQIMRIRKLRNKLPFGWTGNIKQKLKTADPSQISKYSTFKKKMVSPARVAVSNLLSNRKKDLDPTLVEFFEKEMITLRSFERQI